MPTILPVVRQSIGQNAENTFQQPRRSISASTGMGLPSLSESKPEPFLGQQPIVEETKPTPAVTLSPQLTALARKEQKLLQSERALKAREDALAAKEADYLPKSQIKDKIKANAAEGLGELGLTYEELTNLMLEQMNGVDPQAIELKKLQDEVASIKSASEQNVTKQYEAVVNQYRSEVKKLVDSDPNFETVKVLGQSEAVVQHIISTYEEDGIALTVNEALNDIEEYLLEDALKMASLTKVKAKLQPPTPEKTLPAPKTGLRTLTQAVSSSPTRTHNQSQHLSMSERIAQAVARTQK